MKRTEKKCEWCGRIFTPKSSKQRFCGTSCSAKWRMSLPEIKMKLKNPERSKKISQKLKEAHLRNPEWAKITSLRMKENNPMKNPESVEKMKKTLKEMGFYQKALTGGNGKPLPRAQRILWAALGPEWKIEYPIKTKMPRDSGYPTCYKVDIALPKEKIWIEVDGWSHELSNVKMKDKKKEEFLKILGWKGLRFKNEEVENNLPEVLSTISKFLDTHRTTQKDF